MQKSASVPASVHSIVDQERHLVDWATFKARRSDVLAEWHSPVG